MRNGTFRFEAPCDCERLHIPAYQIAFFALIVSACLGGCSAKLPLDPVLVGHVASISGPDRTLGEHARQGIVLAAEATNADIDPAIDRRILVFHGDTRGEDMGPVAIRLITVNGVSAVLGGMRAAEIDSLVSAARPYNVPLVAPGGIQPPAGDGHVFPVGLSPAFQSLILARFTLQQLKLTRFAVVTNEDDKRPLPDRAQTQALAGAFARAVRQNGGAIQGEWPYKNRGELKGVVDRLRADKPAAVLVVGVADDVPEIRAAGLDPALPLLFAGSDGSAHALKGNPAANGVYLATAFVPDASPRAQQFAKTVQERFGEPPDVDSALAYDSARLLFEAIRQSKANDAPRLRQALADIKTFESLTGPLSWGQSREVCRPGFIIRIENGQVQKLQRYEPELAQPDAHSAAGQDIRN